LREHNLEILRAVQDILQTTGEQPKDLSGNPILLDSGVWLRNQIKSHFKDADLKYIDPSYLIRSIPTTSGDRIYCKVPPSPPPPGPAPSLYKYNVREANDCQARDLRSEIQIPPASLQLWASWVPGEELRRRIRYSGILTAKSGCKRMGILFIYACICTQVNEVVGISYALFINRGRGGKKIHRLQILSIMG
jgi:hypothetical protein